MITKEDVVPIVVGVGDGLVDAGFNYLDKVTGTQGKPVLKRASTLAHLATAVTAGVVSVAALRGNARLMGCMIAGRHMGAFVGKIAEAMAEGEPVLEVAEEGDVEVEVEEIPGEELELGEEAEEKAQGVQGELVQGEQGELAEALAF